MFVRSTIGPTAFSSDISYSVKLWLVSGGRAMLFIVVLPPLSNIMMCFTLIVPNQLLAMCLIALMPGVISNMLNASFFIMSLDVDV